MESRSLTFSGQRHPSSQSAIIGSIATWCESLQGCVPVRTALKKIAKGYDVEAIALSRLPRDLRGEATTICFDVLEAGSSRPPLDRSYAEAVLGRHIRYPGQASVWFKTLDSIETDPRLESFHNARNLTELAVIALSIETAYVFFLELHFAPRIGSGHYDLINECATTLAETWSNRTPGLMTETTLNRRAQESHMSIGVPVLDVENPARLSRAEFRICLLLSQGLSRKAICQELRISDSTLRSHLRSVYAKTDTSNQSELLFMLLSGSTLVPSTGVAA